MKKSQTTSQLIQSTVLNKEKRPHLGKYKYITSEFAMGDTSSMFLVMDKEENKSIDEISIQSPQSDHSSQKSY
jgi:hypothetical protein